jgi:long-chain acyl-CoA synthetase
MLTSAAADMPTEGGDPLRTFVSNQSTMGQSIHEMVAYLRPVSEVRPAKDGVPSASRVYRNKVALDGFPDLSKNGVTTLYELFQYGVKKFAGEKCLGYRPVTDGSVGDYEWLTYADTAERVEGIASGLAGLGLSAGDRVGVYGVNCCEWMIAMQVRDPL